ncbi:MAG: 50S ribosomal protein L7ae-like protein [Oscillospiraceae bacterium]|nr:50S ribosomal protein L7ae-like protein [Oscillospiraceae bacterium]MDE7011313.1 ribosomal L7Ae/L30e/S12e/Gadd45 family protein [Oscillospiraceae bacterium]
MLTQLRSRKKVTGVKQSARAVRDGCAQLVFLARDADPALTARVREQCRAQGVEVAEGFTMRELGQAAGIQVGAAVAAVLKS